MTEKVAAMREVQCAAEVAMDTVIRYITTTKQPTAERAHALVDEVLTLHGCESPHSHIVAGGIQSAEPHEQGTGVLNPGEPIVIDIFPRSKTSGFYADMSRTICVGDPLDQLVALYEAVLAAQEYAISMLRPGVVGGDIQNAVEEFFAQKGFRTHGKGAVFPFKEGFVHSVGHGVGKDVHEAPRIGRNSEDVLREGDVVTIEPGLYYMHIGGVRIEDMLLITAGGSENLTKYPKTLTPKVS